MNERLVRFDKRVASLRSAPPFPTGSFYALSWKSLDALSHIKLDVLDASPHSSAWQEYFTHALVMNALISCVRVFQTALVAKARVRPSVPTGPFVCPELKDF